MILSFPPALFYSRPLLIFLPHLAKTEYTHRIIRVSNYSKQTRIYRCEASNSDVKGNEGRKGPNENQYCFWEKVPASSRW